MQNNVLVRQSSPSPVAASGLERAHRSTTSARRLRQRGAHLPRIGAGPRHRCSSPLGRAEHAFVHPRHGLATLIGKERELIRHVGSRGEATPKLARASARPCPRGPDVQRREGSARSLGHGCAESAGCPSRLGHRLRCAKRELAHERLAALNVQHECVIEIRDRATLPGSRRAGCPGNDDHVATVRRTNPRSTGARRAKPRTAFERWPRPREPWLVITARTFGRRLRVGSSRGSLCVRWLLGDHDRLRALPAPPKRVPGCSCVHGPALSAERPEA